MKPSHKERENKIGANSFFCKKSSRIPFDVDNLLPKEKLYRNENGLIGVVSNAVPKFKSYPEAIIHSNAESKPSVLNVTLAPTYYFQEDDLTELRL